MVYVLKEKPWKSTKMNAGSKAREDVDKIFQSISAKTIELNFDIENRKIVDHFRYYYQYKQKLLNELSKGDILFIQFPIIAHTIFLSKLLVKLKRKGVKTVLIIHDLEIIRNSLSSSTTYKQKIRCKFEEMSLLRKCNAVIVHNNKMKEFLTRMGIDKEKQIELGVFDYLGETSKFTEKTDSVVIAGNLKKEKAGYIYKLPKEPRYSLYGMGCKEDELASNVSYEGSYMPCDLLKVVSGAYGLVWDGNSSKTCDGVYGQYMKYNNPHKTSLYLACGLPIIIWEEAAMCRFIIENNFGIAVASLDDIPEKLKEISDIQYTKMRKNVEKIAIKIKQGYFMKTAINKAIRCVENDV